MTEEEEEEEEEEEDETSPFTTVTATTTKKAPTPLLPLRYPPHLIAIASTATRADYYYPHRCGCHRC